MKSPEELKSIKEETETINAKFQELSDEELEQVAGGDYWDNGFIMNGNGNGIQR